MKRMSISALLFLISFNSYSQITKHNWLIGGSGAFSHDKTTFSTGGISSSQINFNPRIGYFLADHFALGLIGDYAWVSTKSNNIKSSYTNYGIGPFLRYYILPSDYRTNLIIEANGTYNEQSNNLISDKSSFFSYGISAGPVIFLNSSVGLELLLGYKGYKVIDESTKNNGIQINIGIQFHLERDK
ncbi:MAG: outer membrane beta-barrel protein [Chitinophagaceae bacterium]